MSIGRKIFVQVILLILLLTVGGASGSGSPKKSKEIIRKAELGTTIGSLVEVFSVDSIKVRGYAILGGLRGTGSSQCPAEARSKLKKYILRQLPGIDVNKFIDSSNTAVVFIEGIMPATASKRRRFDLTVTALDGTQTTSLEGGWLYGADLNAKGTFRVLAHAEGPVYIDKIDTDKPNKMAGYILNGGSSLQNYKIAFVLRRPDYKTANLIRNLLNERFGGDTAKASSDTIELKVPAEYSSQQQRFVSIVKAMYLRHIPEVIKERILTFVRKLAISDEKEQSEIALEAIGKQSVGKLSALLNSSNEEVRLRAARCMLNLGSDGGLESLRRISFDENSKYRIEALTAITRAASRNNAAVICRRLLKDEDFAMRLAAYESLRHLDDVAIMQSSVGRIFYLEQISQMSYKDIYVSRSGEPRIVLFGAPMSCRDNIFVQSDDGSITINAPAGGRYVSVIRKLPGMEPIELKSSFELTDIIRTLCEEPQKRTEKGQVGLGVSYPEVISLLKRMCDKGIIPARFHAGPLPKIGLKVKGKPLFGR